MEDKQITKHAGGISKPSKDEKLVYNVTEVALGNFPSEKRVEEYIYSYIDVLMREIFKEKVVKAERQKRIEGRRFITKISRDQIISIPKCRAKIDLYVECKSGNNYAFELKNSKKTNSTSSIYAISQLLYYSVLCPSINKLVIVSTKYDDGFLEVIKKFKLPIEYLLFAKNQIFSLIK